VLFKLGAVPFHMWVPDVYQGAAVSVTALIALAPKLASLVLLWRVLTQAFPGLQAQSHALLAIMSAMSLIVGNLLALPQNNVKRLLAYSAIGNIGFILLSMLLGTPQGYAASLFYMVIYVLMTLAALAVIMTLSTADKEAEQISDFQGLSKRSPWLATVMLCVMLSLAGIPPMAGFYSKLLVLQAVINAQLWSLAVLAVIFTVIAAYYYLRIVKVMFFEEPPVGTLSTPPQGLSLGARILLTLNAAALLGLGLVPAPLLNYCVQIFS
jgi:NADH-quinone oxidoreductase subunit N